MCYVIVTARSLLWTLLTIISCLGMLISIPTPKWLIGPPVLVNTNVTSRASIGVYTLCSWHDGYKICGPFTVEGLTADSRYFPAFWKASFIFLASGLALASITALASILAFCKQSLCRKSIFTLAGATQAVAAILYIIGLVLYPAGWDSHRAQTLCGDEAAPYYPGECTIGWALYSAVGSMALTLFCALLSMQAEVATSSDKVEFQIQQGRSLICLW